MCFQGFCFFLLNFCFDSFIILAYDLSNISLYTFFLSASHHWRVNSLAPGMDCRFMRLCARSIWNNARYPSGNRDESTSCVIFLVLKMKRVQNFPPTQSLPGQYHVCIIGLLRTHEEENCPVIDAIFSLCSFENPCWNLCTAFVRCWYYLSFNSGDRDSRVAGARLEPVFSIPDTDCWGLYALKSETSRWVYGTDQSVLLNSV